MSSLVLLTFSARLLSLNHHITWATSPQYFSIAFLKLGPGGMHILERWQIAANHLLSSANDAAVCSGGEDGLNDGGVEVHHH